MTCTIERSELDDLAPNRQAGSTKLEASSRTWVKRNPGWRGVLTVLAIAALVTGIVLLTPWVGAMGEALGHPRWGWLVLAIVGEALSMIALALLQRRMLRVGGVHVTVRRMVNVTFAANAMNVTLPAGSVLAFGYTFRRMRHFGASAALAMWSLLSSGMLSMVAFSALAIVASVTAGSAGVSGVAVTAGLVASVAVLLALVVAVRRPLLVARVATTLLGWANRLRRREGSAGVAWVRRTVAEASLIRPSKRDWLGGLWYSAVNWIGDLACLVFSCYAVGLTGLTIQLALMAYVAAMAASSISLLPGGVGGVDAALLLALIDGGITAPVAAAAVLIYRLISFVLVAAVGWVIWVFIHGVEAIKSPSGRVSSSNTADITVADAALRPRPTLPTLPTLPTMPTLRTREAGRVTPAAACGPG